MIVAAIGVLGFSLGVIFGLPVREGNFATVKIGGVTLAAEVVSDRASMARGLSYRSNLAQNGAMLFLFDRPDRYGFWMKEMLFPIDIFWIKDNRIVDMEERASPPAPGADEKSLPVYVPDVPADMVLETRAGFAAEHHVRIGDAVEIMGFQSPVGKRAGGTENAMSLSPGEQYTIEYARAHPSVGSDFKINGILSNPNGDGYKKFSVAYRSGDLVISGVMNVPSGSTPDGGFPLLILNHGLIQSEVYFSGRGSKREQDFFARNGYITIHPDYRGLASSSPNPALHHDFYEGYAQDVQALIDALKKTDTSLIDTDRIGMWGHSMGGGIAARAMVRSHDIRAYVLFAPISADAEDNFYELTDEEVEWLHGEYGPAGSPLYRKISPISYFADVAAPVQLHHGTDDRDVPIVFSERMYDTLTQLGKKTELFKYPGEKHEFISAWPLAAARALRFFDTYVKNAI